MEELRFSLREQTFQTRELHRQSLLAQIRNIEAPPMLRGNIDVATLAKNLRSRSKTDKELLSNLKHCFLQSSENINTFVKVDGSIQGLVRELSGQNASHQLEAAYCLCNLAMKDEKINERITLAAGPYLISHLDSMNVYLVEACCWALGNISHYSDEKCISILKNQGVLTALVGLLKHESVVVTTAAAHALEQFIYQSFNTLQSIEINQITDQLVSSPNYSFIFIMYLISSTPMSHPKFLENNYHITALKNLEQLLSQEESQETLQQITSNIRLIGNLLPSMCEEQVLQLIQFNDGSLLTVLMRLLSSSMPHLRKETVWLCSNVATHQISAPFFYNNTALAKIILKEFV